MPDSQTEAARIKAGKCPECGGSAKDKGSHFRCTACGWEITCGLVDQKNGYAVSHDVDNPRVWGNAPPPSSLTTRHRKYIRQAIAAHQFVVPPCDRSDYETARRLLDLLREMDAASEDLREVVDPWRYADGDPASDAGDMLRDNLFALLDIEAARQKYVEQMAPHHDPDAGGGPTAEGAGYAFNEDFLEVTWFMSDDDLSTEERAYFLWLYSRLHLLDWYAPEGHGGK